MKVPGGAKDFDNLPALIFNRWQPSHNYPLDAFGNGLAFRIDRLLVLNGVSLFCHPRVSFQLLSEVLQQFAGDYHPLNLIRALDDLSALPLAHQSLDRRVFPRALAAVDLN